ncbi:hypothetical protein [Streptomyces sp. SID1034]|uniref:hypothetical protein n=1 Tax=Streptomyces TaxID=1883 RepID=UPI001368BBD1|nr:hypothetical protein [Streptomyces sp. SID1034]MYV89725.1 hypothetical protein [Streptomyces sp. SID1034]
MTAPILSAQHPAVGRATPGRLRTILRVDGWSTAVFGVVLLACGRPLSEPLGLPVTWSVPFGIAMLGGAGALALIAGYPHVPRRLVVTVLVANALSCAALVVLACTDVVPLTGWGRAFMVVGAVVVMAFAELEYVALRGPKRAGSS